MIQRGFITQWRSLAPWALDAQVEQDLILSRTLVELFTAETIPGLVAFRGGTALHKLHFPVPGRYSEDIDLVQLKAGPIGPLMNAVRGRLDSWLGTPQWKQGPGRVTLYYRFTTEIEPVQRARLKIEIGTREHLCVLGLEERRFEVVSRWFSGHAEIQTYALDELLGTKLRALYQRKKGRDLYDLWAASRLGAVDPVRVAACFSRYLAQESKRVSRAEFEANLHQKLIDRRFLRDVAPLLAAGATWDDVAAAAYILDEIAPLLPGERWRGMG